MVTNVVEQEKSVGSAEPKKQEAKEQEEKKESSACLGQVDETGIKPKSSNPPENKDVSSSAMAWNRAIKSYERTAKWILGAFVGIVAAAIGSSPFLVLTEIESVGAALWTAWGLTAMLTGTLIILFVSSELQTQMKINMGSLLTEDGPDDLLKKRRLAITHEYQQTRKALGMETPEDVEAARETTSAIDTTWRAPQSLEAVLQWGTLLDERRWELSGKIQDHLDSEECYDDGKVSRLSEARREVIAQGNEVWSWISTHLQVTLFELVRNRFRKARTVLLLAAVVVAIGLVAFFAAARINPLMSQDQPSAAARTVPVDAVAVFTDAPAAAAISTALPGCDFEQPLAVELNGGLGTTSNPWQISRQAGGTCRGFSLSLTSKQATVATLSANPAVPEDGTQLAIVIVRSDELASSKAAQAPDCVLTRATGLWELLGGTGTAREPWLLRNADIGPCQLVTLTLTAGDGEVIIVDQGEADSSDAFRPAAWWPNDDGPSVAAWAAILITLGVLTVMAGAATRPA